MPSARPAAPQPQRHGAALEPRRQRGVAEAFAQPPPDVAEAADRAAAGMHSTGAFAEPEQWRVTWERPYTREEWLDQVPTFGGHDRLPPGALQELLAEVAAAVDAVGGGFTTRYTTVVVSAPRTGAAGRTNP